MAKRTSTKTTTTPKADVQERITAFIIEGLEKATDPTEWPWVKAAKAGPAVNVVTKKAYNGLNRMVLGMLMDGGASRYWATFNQWKGKGATVRKGETGTLIFFWGDLYLDENDRRCDKDTPGARKILYAKGATVFHAAQVEGWTAPEAGTKEAEELTAAGAQVEDDIEAWLSNTGAEIRIEGERAFYAPALDRIVMPARERFKDTATASATQHFYAVTLHELIHWTGHASRLDRLKGDAFGSAGYAREELIAEIGSAFLSAELGIVPQPRADNVTYVQSWLEVLKGDKRAIFTASTAATKAGAFLHALQPQGAAPEIEDDQEEEEPQALAA